MSDVATAPPDVVMPRANPPIVIGPFTNVPAPGSPIRSDWAQSISTYTAQHQPLTLSQVGNGGTSGGAWPVVDVTFGAQPVAGHLLVVSHFRADFAAGSGYVWQLAINSAVQAQWNVGNFTTSQIFHLTAITAVAANTAARVQVSGSGTANVTTYGDPTYNRHDMVWLPDR